MVLKRAVILKIHYMPNGLTSIIMKKIQQIFRDQLGEDEKLAEEKFVKKL